MSIRTFFGGRTGARALMLASVFLVVACDDDDPIDPGASHNWAADIAGAGTWDAITGNAAVTANRVSFLADIELAGAEPDAVFSWGVFAGTCDDIDARVGLPAAYQDLVADAGGAVAGDAQGPGGMTSGSDYVVQITAEVDEDEVVVACSDLIED